MFPARRAPGDVFMIPGVFKGFVQQSVNFFFNLFFGSGAFKFAQRYDDIGNNLALSDFNGVFRRRIATVVFSDPAVQEDFLRRYRFDLCQSGLFVDFSELESPFSKDAVGVSSKGTASSWMAE